MIQEDYVSFEVAKLLKEKGFDEKCFYCFDDVIGESRLSKLMICNNSELVEHYYAAPTLQMAMKWLREEKLLHIDPFCIPEIYGEHSHGWGFLIRKMIRNKLGQWNQEDNTSFLVSEKASDDEIYNKYEEACEAGIKYCLENLI